LADKHETFPLGGSQSRHSSSEIKWTCHIAANNIVLIKRFSEMNACLMTEEKRSFISSAKPVYDGYNGTVHVKASFIHNTSQTMRN